MYALYTKFRLIFNTITMPGRWLSSFEKGQIVALYRHAHWPIQQISSTLNIPKTSVYRVTLQSEHGDPQTPPRPKGRRPVCTTRKRRRLIDRLSTDAFHRRLRLDQIAFLEGFRYDIRTIQKALWIEGYRRRRARKKPWLTEAHKAARLKWAKEHVNWSDRQWTRVLWTDEASIRCGYFGQVYVTRTAEEEFHPDCIIPRFRKYSACMIWGCIASDGPKGCVIFDKGSINGARYRVEILPRIHQIVQSHLDSSLFQQQPVIMQDNASIHKARETIASFHQLSIQLMEWPANSPDLNPIENLWSLLKYRIGYHFPTTREEVEAAVQLEWSRLTTADIAKICQSMRQRC